MPGIDPRRIFPKYARAVQMSYIPILARAEGFPIPTHLERIESIEQVDVPRLSVDNAKRQILAGEGQHLCRRLVRVAAISVTAGGPY